MNTLAKAFVATTLIGAGAAQGAIVQVDVNSMIADAAGPFGGTGHTGVISLGTTVQTFLEDVKIDGVSQTVTGVLQSLSGSITLAAGTVTGGQLDLALNDGSGLSLTFAPGGFVFGPQGESYGIGGLTFTAAFTNLVGGTSFGGVDVSAYAGVGLEGSYLIHQFAPNENGIDKSTDIDIFLVPAPGAACLIAMAGVLAGRRRRI